MNSRFISILPCQSKTTINMKKYALSVICFSILFSCTQPKQDKVSRNTEGYSVDGKKVLVYTTADSTDLRLTVTDTLSFKELKQPVETQVCIFVDPDKKFQTFLGIGGALTDASAETFSKLPQDKQDEILDSLL